MIIKVSPHNVIFQGIEPRPGAGQRTGENKTLSIWEQRDEGLRAGIPLGRLGGKSEVNGR